MTKVEACDDECGSEIFTIKQGKQNILLPIPSTVALLFSESIYTASVSVSRFLYVPSKTMGEKLLNRRTRIRIALLFKVHPKEKKNNVLPYIGGSIKNGANRVYEQC